MEYVQLMLCGYGRGKLGDVMTPSRPENEVLPQSTWNTTESSRYLNEDLVKDTCSTQGQRQGPK